MKYDDEFRSHIQWYKDLEMKRWYHVGLQGWQKSLRKSDVLMAVMFKSQNTQNIKMRDVQNIVGDPDYIHGNVHNGRSYYLMYRNSGLLCQEYAMCYFVNFGFVVSAGTNYISNFVNSGALKRYTALGYKRIQAGIA